MQAVMNKLWDCLLPAMGPAALPPNPAAHSQLTGLLAGLHFDPPAGEALSPLAEKVSGRKLVLPKNPLKLQWMTFDFGAQGAHFTLRMGRRTHSFDLGLGTWQFGKSAVLGRRSMRVACSGVWTAPDTFQVTLRHYESPFCQTITCQFSDGGAVIDQQMNVGFGPKEAPKLEGKFE
jgi:hypothetical protein